MARTESNIVMSGRVRLLSTFQTASKSSGNHLRASAYFGELDANDTLVEVVDKLEDIGMRLRPLKSGEMGWREYMFSRRSI